MRIVGLAVCALVASGPAWGAPNACALFPQAEAEEVLGGPVTRYRTPQEAADGPACSYWSGAEFQSASYAEVVLEPAAGDSLAAACAEGGGAVAQTPAGPACRTGVFASYVLQARGHLVRAYVGPISRKGMDAEGAQALAERIAARLPQ